MRKNCNLNTPSPHTSLLPRLIFAPNSLYLPPHEQHWGWGMGAMQDFIMFSLLHLPQGKESTHSSPDPARGPHCGRQFSVNFFSGSFPMGCSFGQTSPAWVPLGVCQQTCSIRSTSFPSFSDLGACRAVTPTYSHASLQL